MPALFIETATERGMVAILDKEQILSHVILPFGHQNSRHLLPEIERILGELKLAVKDLEYIACGKGPGSYTGIRVGAIVAKSLSFACNIPLIGISTLQTFIPDEEGEFAALIDAKIGGVYMIKGIKKDNTIVYHSEPEIVETSKMENGLAGIGSIVTPLVAPLRGKLSNLPLKWEEKGPDPRQMGKIAEQKFQSGEFSVDGFFEIDYLRKTQAEIERDSR